MAFDWRMRDPDHQTNIESRRYIDDMIYNGRTGTVVGPVSSRQVGRLTPFVSAKLCDGLT